MTKSEKANALIIKGLKELQAKGGRFNDFDVQTRYGELKVSIAMPMGCRGKYATLACFSRFTDVDKAKGHVSCNPHSGKWNWIVWAREFTAKQFADYVLGEIKKILQRKFMYILKHDNVDGCGSTWGKWKRRPTKEQFKEVLRGYYDDEEKLDSICEELFQNGQCDVGDSSCTTFEIEQLI